MKRRGFLQALGAIAASSSLPLSSSPLPTALERALDLVVAEAQKKVAAQLEYYTVLMHQQQILDLQRLEARWRWIEAWRAYRVARSLGIAPEALEAGTVLKIYSKVLPEVTEQRLYYRGVQWTERQLAGLREHRVEQLTINKLLGT